MVTTWNFICTHAEPQIFAQTVRDNESSSGFTPRISHFASFPLFIVSRTMCSYDLSKVHPFPDFLDVIQRGRTVMNYIKTTEWCQCFHNGTHNLARTSLCTVKIMELVVIPLLSGRQMCSPPSFDPLIPSWSRRVGHWNMERVYYRGCNSRIHRAPLDWIRTSSCVFPRAW